MEHVKSLQCVLCGKAYAPGEVDYVCPDHGSEGILDVQYDYERIARGFSKSDLACSGDTRTSTRRRPQCFQG